MAEKDTAPALSRRALARAVGWAAPAVLATTTVPAYAASPPANPSSLFALIADQVTFDDEQTPDFTETTFAFWFTSPVEASTGRELGGVTTLEAGAVFSLSLSLTYHEGETPRAPVHWEEGTEYTYDPFGAPGAPGSLFNSATVTARMGEGSVRGQTWSGTATFTTQSTATTVGQGAAEGAQILLSRQALGLELAHIAYGNVSLRSLAGTLVVTPTDGSAVAIDLTNRSVMSFIEGQTADAPGD